MVRDRVLKVDVWVLHMEQEIGVYLGKTQGSEVGARGIGYGKSEEYFFGCII